MMARRCGYWSMAARCRCLSSGWSWMRFSYLLILAVASARRCRQPDFRPFACEWLVPFLCRNMMRAAHDHSFSNLLRSLIRFHRLHAESAPRGAAQLKRYCLSTARHGTKIGWLGSLHLAFLWLNDIIHYKHCQVAQFQRDTVELHYNGHGG